MTRAIWNGTVIAESDATVVVEGNHYFPADSVNREHLAPSQTRTTCGWKGEASYYDIVVGEETNRDACWVYEDPKPEAAEIAGHLAFWRGVEVAE